MAAAMAAAAAAVATAAGGRADGVGAGVWRPPRARHHPRGARHRTRAAHGRSGRAPPIPCAHAMVDHRGAPPLPVRSRAARALAVARTRSCAAGGLCTTPAARAAPVGGVGDAVRPRTGRGRRKKGARMHERGAENVIISLRSRFSFHTRLFSASRSRPHGVFRPLSVPMSPCCGRSSGCRCAANNTATAMPILYLLRLCQRSCWLDDESISC